MEQMWSSPEMEAKAMAYIDKCLNGITLDTVSTEDKVKMAATITWSFKTHVAADEVNAWFREGLY